jgi:hypothetical protein
MLVSKVSIAVVFERVLAVVMSLLVALIPVGGAAQSNWEVRADADGAALLEDEDDGLNGRAELSLTIDWTHVDKERGLLTRKVTSKEIVQDWDFFGNDISLLGLAQDLRAVECHGRDPIFVTVTFVESDLLNGVETLLATGAGIVVGITVGTLLAPSGPGAVAGGALAAKIAGASAGAAAGWLFKNVGSDLDDLGLKEARRLDPGNNILALSGEDGGGTVTILDFSAQSADVQIECPPGRGPLMDPQAVDPTTAVAGIFPGALEMLALAGQINREDQTGPGVDPGNRDLRRAKAETAAVYYVMQAREGFDGAAAALPLLAAGRSHHAAGELGDAIMQYREAFRIAYTAIWNGVPSKAYDPADALTLIGPVRRAFPESVQEVTGWVQGMDPGEVLESVDVSGQGAGLETRSIPGVARTAVVLGAPLAGFDRNDLLGLARVSAGVVRPPDAGCLTPHLDEGSIGGGIFIDEQGPFAPPDLDGCGYGEVIETYQNISGGGVPPGAEPDPDGIFTLELSLGNELEPGPQTLTVSARIRDTGSNALREISAPLILLVPDPDRLFDDGFEPGI